MKVKVIHLQPKWKEVFASESIHSIQNHLPVGSRDLNTVSELSFK